jgi:hypothetical protein
MKNASSTKLVVHYFTFYKNTCFCPYNAYAAHVYVCLIYIKSHTYKRFSRLYVMKSLQRADFITCAHSDSRAWTLTVAVRCATFTILPDKSVASVAVAALKYPCIAVVVPLHNFWRALRRL